MTQDLENSTKRLALPEQYSELNLWRSTDIVRTALVGWLPCCATSLLHECSDLAIQDWEVMQRKLSWTLPVIALCLRLITALVLARIGRPRSASSHCACSGASSRSR